MFPLAINVIILVHEFNVGPITRDQASGQQLITAVVNAWDDLRGSGYDTGIIHGLQAKLRKQLRAVSPIREEESETSDMASH